MGILDSFFKKKPDSKTNTPLQDIGPPMPLNDGVPESLRRSPEQGLRYTVKSGDTLSKIAKRYYGDAGAYMRIFNANRDILTDPDRIYPGQILVINDPVA